MKTQPEVDVESFYSPQLAGINYIASVNVGNVRFPTAAAAAAEKTVTFAPTPGVAVTDQQAVTWLRLRSSDWRDVDS